ncbi:MAG: flavin reductase family protein [Bacteroidales bacterium]|nr:flavin reductase family protein [Bacteroidales bacterium]
MKSIPINEFVVKVNDLWLNQWFLLTSGDYKKKHYNTMTVAWGYFGAMWNKPTAVVVVRPTRYTFEFINKYETFTLCAFDTNYNDDLLLLGTKSGRDGDKIAETKLTIMSSQKVPAPSFREAELIIECKKIYWDDFKPENFLDHSIEKNYPKKDYHRFYFGEIVEILGIDKYLNTCLPPA